MRVESKSQLIAAIEAEHEAFLAIAEEIPPRRYHESGVWGDEWTIKDLFVHLTEWEQLFLGWYRAGVAGDEVETPAPGYKWNETSRLNHDLQRKGKRRSWPKVNEAFHRSYDEIFSVAKQIPESELLTRGVYPWTRSTTVGAYLASNSCSHYKTASKILKRWLRQQGD